MLVRRLSIGIARVSNWTLRQYAGAVRGSVNCRHAVFHADVPEGISLLVEQCIAIMRDGYLEETSFHELRHHRDRSSCDAKMLDQPVALALEQRVDRAIRGHGRVEADML